MFGRDGLLLNGKAVLCEDPAGVVFRVGPDGEPGALEVPGARRWSPMGESRGPKGWVLVPAESSRHWRRLGEAAIEFVRTVEK